MIATALSSAMSTPAPLVTAIAGASASADTSFGALLAQLALPSTPDVSVDGDVPPQGDDAGHGDEDDEIIAPVMIASSDIAAMPIVPAAMPMIPPEVPGVAAQPDLAPLIPARVRFASPSPSPLAQEPAFDRPEPSGPPATGFLPPPSAVAMGNGGESAFVEAVDMPDAPAVNTSPVDAGGPAADETRAAPASPAPVRSREDAVPSAPVGERTLGGRGIATDRPILRWTASSNPVNGSPAQLPAPTATMPAPVAAPEILISPSDTGAVVSPATQATVALKADRPPAAATPTEAGADAPILIAGEGDVVATAPDIAPTSLRENSSAPVMATTAAMPVSVSPVAGAGHEVTGPAAGRAIERHLDVARDTAWLDRLTQDIVASADRDSRMRFQLNPERLGALHVEIAPGADGASVRFGVENEAARALIADAQPRLIAEARAQGMRIADAHVDLSGQSGGSGPSAQGGGASAEGFARQHQQPGHGRTIRPDAVMTQPAAEAPARTERYA